MIEEKDKVVELSLNSNSITGKLTFQNYKSRVLTKIGDMPIRADGGIEKIKLTILGFNLIESVFN